MINEPGEDRKKLATQRLFVAKTPLVLEYFTVGVY